MAWDKVKKSNQKNIKPILFSVLLFLILLEIALRISGIYSTYMEKLGKGFVTYYDQTDSDWYHTWSPNKPIIYDQPEFKHEFMANSLGLREKEITLEKPDSIFRIICLGDSYTEGDGVGYENSYPRKLEKILNIDTSRQVTFQVYNAGVCGSDIIYEKVLLRDKLIHFNPDAVIFLINRSDIKDILFRGGEERFQSDGTTKFKNAPWQFYIFRFSHISRMIFTQLNYAGETMLSKNEFIKEYKRATQILIEEIINTRNYCKEKNIKCSFIFHPNSTGFLFAKIDELLEKERNGEKIENNSRYINEIFQPDYEIKEEAEIQSDYYPLIQIFKNYKPTEYSWPINGHYNELGYDILAQWIHNEILITDSSFFNF